MIGRRVFSPALEMSRSALIDTTIRYSRYPVRAKVVTVSLGGLLSMDA